MNLTKTFRDFFESEKAGGVLLIICTFISISAANSTAGESYRALWESKAFGHTLIHWINDGLMTFFFLLIGLELERELYAGELKNLKNALLPVFAAIGGIVVPAIIYIVVNTGNAISGAGIPTATDIAFSIGILSLLGKGIPASLKVFLAAFAIIDDLGAIVIIAVFYSGKLQLVNLVIALALFLLLLVLNRKKVHNLIPYLIAGVAMWYFMLHSGVHPTITGVMLAFAIPFGSGLKDSPSYILQQNLHKPVAFIILPLFALANTAILLNDNWMGGLSSALSIGIITALVVGKPAGILLFSFLAVKLKISSLPSRVSWNHIAGAGMLGGIGFTMSIFITLLAFNDDALIMQAKVAVLLASIIAGICGYIYLKRVSSIE